MRAVKESKNKARETKRRGFKAQLQYLLNYKIRRLWMRVFVKNERLCGLPVDTRLVHKVWIYRRRQVINAFLMYCKVFYIV